MLSQCVSDEKRQHINEYDRNYRECRRIPESMTESDISKCSDIVLESYPLCIPWSIESAEAEINTLKERPYEANNKACKCREYEQRKAALYRSADQNTVHGGVIVFLFLFAQNAHLLSLLITYKLLLKSRGRRVSPASAIY